MRKIMKNIQIKLGYQLPWIAWSLIAYLVVMFFVYYGLINFSLINQQDGSLVYRLSSLILVLFGLSFIFKEDFDLLLTLSNTRKEIFVSLVLSHLIMSMLFAFVIMIEKSVVDQLNHYFHFTRISDSFHYFAPYASNNFFQSYFFFMLLCFFLSMTGFFISSLFYRFGKFFTIYFWIAFTGIPLILLLAFIQAKNREQFFKSFAHFLTSFNIITASLCFLLFSVIITLLAYINIRKLPQN